MTAAELGRCSCLVGRSLRLYLFDPLAKVINLWEVENLSLFVLGQVPLSEELEAFSRRHWKLNLLIKLGRRLLLICCGRSLTILSLKILT